MKEIFFFSTPQKGRNFRVAHNNPLFVVLVHQKQSNNTLSLLTPWLGDLGYFLFSSFAYPITLIRLLAELGSRAALQYKSNS